MGTLLAGIIERKAENDQVQLAKQKLREGFSIQWNTNSSTVGSVLQRYLTSYPMHPNNHYEYLGVGEFDWRLLSGVLPESLPKSLSEMDMDKVFQSLPESAYPLSSLVISAASGLISPLVRVRYYNFVDGYKAESTEDHCIYGDFEPHIYKLLGTILDIHPMIPSFDYKVLKSYIFTANRWSFSEVGGYITAASQGVNPIYIDPSLFSIQKIYSDHIVLTMRYQ